MTRRLVRALGARCRLVRVPKAQNRGVRAPREQSRLASVRLAPRPCTPPRRRAPRIRALGARTRHVRALGTQTRRHVVPSVTPAL